LIFLGNVSGNVFSRVWSETAVYDSPDCYPLLRWRRAIRGARVGGWETESKRNSKGARSLLGFREGGGEVGAAHEIAVEAAGGAVALGDGPDDERLVALHVTRDTHPSCR